jgi:hypothetical protein
MTPIGYRRPNQVLMGLDLGISMDHSALAIGEQEFFAEGGFATHIRNVRRWPLLTTYPAIVSEVERIVSQPWARPHADYLEHPWSSRIDRAFADPPILAVDCSGVGEGVVELLLKARLPATIVAVRITGGAGVSKQKWPGESYIDCWHVAKSLLVSVLVAGLQTEQVVIGRDIEGREDLIREFQDFQAKVTAAGNDKFEAKVGKHDDMIMAISYVAWLPTRPGPGELGVIEHPWADVRW